MLTFAGVSKGYGPVVVLDDVTGRFPSQGLTFLMGPNGAGKTTLIKCILGLEGYRGEILWNGERIRPSERLIFPAFDDIPFHDGLTGAQNLRILAEGSLDGPCQYLGPALLRRRVKTYSYGQRKRLAITAALNSGAPLVVLDEPTNGLDQETLQALRDDILTLRRDTSFLVTGHHLPFYQGLVDHLVALRDGKLVEVPTKGTSEVEKSELEVAYEQHYPPTHR